jgi:hypothetical protein
MTTDILAQQTADLAVIARWGLPPEPYALIDDDCPVCGKLTMNRLNGYPDICDDCGPDYPWDGASDGEGSET